jgi:hypothetical protein
LDVSTDVHTICYAFNDKLLALAERLNTFVQKPLSKDINIRFHNLSPFLIRIFLSLLKFPQAEMKYSTAYHNKFIRNKILCDSEGYSARPGALEAATAVYDQDC